MRAIKHDTIDDAFASALGGVRPTFLKKKSSRRFQKKIPYHGMMPHDLVFRPTGYVALDDSLATPWRLFVLRPLFSQLGQKLLAARRFSGSHAKTLWLLVVLFFIFFAPLYNIYIYIYFIKRIR
jgi:hypothetical protein